MAAFLASGDACWITGEIIVVSGGIQTIHLIQYDVRIAFGSGRSPRLRDFLLESFL